VTLQSAALADAAAPANRDSPSRAPTIILMIISSYVCLATIVWPTPQTHVGGASFGRNGPSPSIEQT
jgi:hypothetical protein